MAQAQRLNPAARDAAVRRITLITTGAVALGLAGTFGLGAAIAAETPVKDTSDTAAYEDVEVREPDVVPPTTGKTPQGTGTATGNGKAATPTQKAPTQPPKPRTTTKAPQTQSGGS